MLNKLAQHPDWYEGILVRRDPFKLLRLIKKYMYEVDSSVYVQYNKEMNMRRFMGITQRDDEDIHEFTLRFKQYRDIAEQHVGKTMYNHAAQQAEDFATLPESTKNLRIKAE